ncbi:MAG: type II secretion system F family protein [Nitrospirae bacterium]|nr:type II secretion system F family protein [Nitrospirota bacterium]
MPVFQYRARNQSGELVVGSIESLRREDVAFQLDRLGYIPVGIKELRKTTLTFLKADLFRSSSASQEDLIVFTRQLHTLLSAGLSITYSFEALKDQTENLRFKGVISRILTDIEGGNSISDALARHPKIFDPLYINMIKAGEAGGILDITLDRLAEILEHSRETGERIRTATRYPKIVLISLLLAVIVLMTFVIPQFVKLYSGFKVPLPLPTRILIGANNIFHVFWPVFLLLGIAIYWGARAYIRTDSGRRKWDGLKLKIPVFGKIFLKTSLSRFARVFGNLTRTGLPILETLDMVSSVVGNVVIAKVVEGVRDSARKGKGLVEPMKSSGIFPPIVIQMTAIGEETGQLEEMLLKVSEYFDRDVEYAIKNLSASLEPILLLFVGCMVLFLALAVFMPWWNLISVFKGAH